MESKSKNSSPSPSPPPPQLQPPKRHVVLFPFMAKGHTIPLLHLARLLLHRQISVTFFTTTANRPFIADSLSDTSATIVTLPFPNNIPGIPAGVESTDHLPSISLLYSFALATELIKPHFEKAFENLLPHVSFLVSDGFLWWTNDSASKLGVPRFVFYGMSTYAMSISRDMAVTQLLTDRNIGHHDLVTVPSFPWIKVTKSDFPPRFSDPKANPLALELVKKHEEATGKSSGMIVNSFYEVEPAFADYWDEECGPKTYYVGPLCLAYEYNDHHHRPSFVHQWLDEKIEKGVAGSVLYVAFGSQADISPQQLKEIAKGLEESEVSFVWVMRKKDQGDHEYLPEGFEERVRKRGIVVREWVEQREILMNKKVKGFLSHCGWNSVLESLCAAVPILAWPMMAEQPLNTKMVVEVMKVGIRVDETTNCDGKSIVKWEELKKKVKELMEGETGREVSKKVKEVAEMARKAVEEGGSSWHTLDKLINEAC